MFTVVATAIPENQTASSPSSTRRRTRQLKGLLTDARLRNLETRDKPYKVFDGNSLYLLVAPSGLRGWRWKYTFAGKEKLLSLGTYPEVSLAQARAARDEAKRKLSSNVDPMQERGAAKRAAKVAQSDSFESVALAWHEVWKATKHPRYADNVLSRLKTDVFPQIGSRKVSEIKAPDLVAMLEKMEARGARDSARKTKYTCGQVFRYAVAKGLTEVNPAVGFRPSDILRSRVVKHHARISDAELPQLLRKIEAYQGTATTRLAMKLLALTFVRTSELRGAKWCEINWDAAEWKIPAERMKKRVTHVVPLALQAINVLRTLQVITGQSELLFPGDRDPKKPMSDNTILKALERMGYAGIMTGHGFRGLASTHLYEKQFPGDHIELQLAHVKDKVRGAYDHSRQLPARRKMMEYWADFLEKALKGNV